MERGDVIVRLGWPLGDMTRQALPRGDELSKACRLFDVTVQMLATKREFQAATHPDPARTIQRISPIS